MVNENFGKFSEEQQKHRPFYISNKHLNNRGSLNPSNYNTQEDTDKSVGATGRTGLE
jgi:hypothetical protein